MGSITIIGVLSDHLTTVASQEYLCGILLHVLLALKRKWSCFIDDTEAWIFSVRVDTRQAGVLLPIKKTMVSTFFSFTFINILFVYLEFHPSIAYFTWS